MTTGGTMRRDPSTVQPELSKEVPPLVPVFAPPLEPWEPPLEDCWCGLVCVVGAVEVTGAFAAGVVAGLGTAGVKTGSVIGTVVAATPLTTVTR
jgi:hypothetical protein